MQGAVGLWATAASTGFVLSADGEDCNAALPPLQAFLIRHPHCLWWARAGLQTSRSHQPLRGPR